MCEADHATAFGAPAPGTITCETGYVRQAGFDGDLPDLLRAVDVAARKLGWSDRDGRLQTALGYYETSRRAGTPVDAGVVPAISYTVPPPAAGTTGCSSPDYLRESSVERSSAPWAKERAPGRDDSARTAARPPVRPDVRPPAAVQPPRGLNHSR